MVSTRTAHGLHMACIRLPQDLHRACTWLPHGLHTDCLWPPHDLHSASHPESTLLPIRVDNLPASLPRGRVTQAASPSAAMSLCIRHTQGRQETRVAAGRVSGLGPVVPRASGGTVQDSKRHWTLFVLWRFDCLTHRVRQVLVVNSNTPTSSGGGLLCEGKFRIHTTGHSIPWAKLLNQEVDEGA